MTESQESGLTWISLAEIENIDDILVNLAKLTTDAKFEQDEKGLEYCTAKEVSEAARPIFATFKSQSKVDFEMRGNALRLRPGITTLTSHSAYLISVKVWGSNATVESVTFAPKYMAHIKEKVNIKVEKESVVDVFYVVKKPKKETKK